MSSEKITELRLHGKILSLVKKSKEEEKKKSTAEILLWISFMKKLFEKYLHIYILYLGGLGRQKKDKGLLKHTYVDMFVLKKKLYEGFHVLLFICTYVCMYLLYISNF